MKTKRRLPVILVFSFLTLAGALLLPGASEPLAHSFSTSVTRGAGVHAAHQDSSDWQVEDMHSGATHTSPALDSTGNSRPRYHDDTNDDLKYAYAYPVAVTPAKLGELYPFSGALGMFGESLHRSALLAIHHPDEAGYEVETVIADTETDHSAAVEAARRLVEDEEVYVLIGAAASGVTIPVAESVSIPSQVPQISYASTSPQITALPADEGKDFLFRTSPSDALQATVLARLLRDESLRKVSVLYVNNPYGQGLNDVFKETFEGLGGKVVASVPHNEEPAPSYAAELDQATEGKPEALLAMSYGFHATVYLKEAIEGGFIDNFRFVGATRSQEIIDAVGAEALEGMCGTAPGVAETESLRIYNETYEVEYGEEPPLPFMANTYDAVIVAALAAYEAQMAGEELTPVAIRNHLRSVAGPLGEKITTGVEGMGRALELLQQGKDIDYVGASGEVGFDENGDVVTPIEIWCFRGGQIVTERLEIPVPVTKIMGFVTGGGWIDSPPGAYTPDPTLTGEATFHFTSKYKKGATQPTGETEFHLADLNFRSTGYQWLVIAGRKAQFTGSGTINGSGNYGLLLTVTDGQMNGGGADKFRIKIWDKVTEEVVYDNQTGDADGARATYAISGGNIVIHSE
jgi:branched-chain amino acid transport system substrate-binding protein